MLKKQLNIFIDICFLLSCIIRSRISTLTKIKCLQADRAFLQSHLVSFPNYYLQTKILLDYHLLFHSIVGWLNLHFRYLSKVESLVECSFLITP